MNDSPQYTSLHDYRRVLREQRILVVLIVIAFTGAAIGISIRQDKQYQATATIDVQQENADLQDVGLTVPTTQTPEQRAAIGSQRVMQTDVARRANENLDPKLPSLKPGAYLDVTPQARTNLIALTARNADPQRAAQVANAFADAARDVLTKERRKVYAERAKTFKTTLKTISRDPNNNFTRASLVDRISRLQNLSKIAAPVDIVENAAVPSTPVSPKPVRNGLLGFLLGLTVALLAAVVRDALDRRFKSQNEISDSLQLPLVGHVRNDALGRSLPNANGRELTGAELDAFRIVRTNVEFLSIDEPPKRIAVTSAVAEEGKSTVAAALAAAYALSGKRALLVECDLRRPTLAARLGLQPSPGLSDYLIGRAEPQQVLQAVALDPTGNHPVETNGSGPSPAPVPNLVCITAGTRTPQPAELLGSKKFSTFLSEVSEAYDIIVLDTCPLLAVVDTLELIPNVDSILMCLRASRTTREQARAAHAAIDRLPSRPTGIVVTGVRPGSESDYGYYAYAYGDS